MMPSSVNIPDEIVRIPSFSVSEEEKQPVEERIVEVLQIDEEALEAELKQIQEKAAFASQMQAKQSKVTPGLLFEWEDNLAEVPTFVRQPGVISNAASTEDQSDSTEISVNDQLSKRNTELADQLGASPIKDLKKAIGINDRFVFINELFRGDESMYERSIKTINNFTIYAEAQYWIERELKVKLGWDNERSVTQDFYALVRRRFA
jgi:hypothetical protein